MSDLFDEAVEEPQTRGLGSFGASRFTESQFVWTGHGTDNPWDDAVALTLAAVHTHLTAWADRPRQTDPH